MEKRSIAQHIYMRIIFDEFPQAFHGIFMCLRLAHVECDLLFKICPAVCHCIVHMYRVPHDVCEEAHCIIMEFLCVCYRHIPALRVIAPL